MGGTGGQIAIAGVGCAVADFVYNRVDFTSPVFQKYLSKTQGDGGLSPGKLVFVEEFESFSGKSFDQVRAEIVGTRDPDTLNLGGPAIVALISAAQLLSQQQAGVSFYGVRGNDWVKSWPQHRWIVPATQLPFPPLPTLVSFPTLRTTTVMASALL